MLSNAGVRIKSRMCGLDKAVNTVGMIGRFEWLVVYAWEPRSTVRALFVHLQVLSVYSSPSTTPAGSDGFHGTSCRRYSVGPWVSSRDNSTIQSICKCVVQLGGFGVLQCVSFPPCRFFRIFLLALNFSSVLHGRLRAFLPFFTKKCVLNRISCSSVLGTFFQFFFSILNVFYYSIGGFSRIDLCVFNRNAP